MGYLAVAFLLMTGCAFNIEPLSTDGSVDSGIPSDMGPEDLTGADLTGVLDLTQLDGPPPTCSDGVQNGNETAIDCGGGVCARCGSGKGCSSPTDCISGVCDPAVCAGGLVAYYSFNEGMGTTAADSSGNGNHGTLVAGPTWTAGKVGMALDFDGSGARVSVPSSASLDLTTGMSISAWVTADSFPAWTGFLMKASSASWTDGYGVYNTAGTGPLCGYAQNFNIKSCAVLTAGAAFHHIALTYDRVLLLLYVDGLQVGTLPSTALITTNGAPLLIGQATGSAGWDGKVDEVRIFNRGLTAAEVQDLFTSP